MGFAARQEMILKLVQKMGRWRLRQEKNVSPQHAPNLDKRVFDTKQPVIANPNEPQIQPRVQQKLASWLQIQPGPLEACKTKNASHRNRLEFALLSWAGYTSSRDVAGVACFTG